MFALLQRAHDGKNLSPAERAALRLLEGIVATFLVAGVQAAVQQLALGSVRWQDAAQTALVAGIMAALFALLKYVKAHGDAPLAATLLPLLGTTLARVEHDNADVQAPMAPPDFVNTARNADPNATLPLTPQPSAPQA